MDIRSGEELSLNPALSSASTVDVDRDIDKLERALSALRSHRNSLSAVSRLPTEILCHIFTYLDISCRQFLPDSQSSWMWQSVTHVCRHWRDIALTSPTLWTYIDLRSPFWTQESLQRSQMAPLVVHARIRDESSRQMFQELELAHSVLDEAPRIRELSLSCATDIMIRLESRLCEPFLVLETLSLDAGTPGAWHDDVYHLPEDFFGGDLPRLRKLSLRMCALQPTSPILVGLTYLHVGDMGALGGYCMKDLLTLLGSTSQLESLILDHAVMEASTRKCDSSAEETHTVTLARLSLLRLNGSVSSCVSVLTSLSLPSSAVVQISCSFMQPDSEDELSLVPTLFNCQRIDVMRPFRAIEFHNPCTQDSGLHFSGWVSDALPHDNDDATANTIVTITWDDDSVGGMETRIIRDACSSIDLSEVQSLSVCTSESLSRETLLLAFRAARKVMRARIRGRSVYGFVDALLPTDGLLTVTSDSSNFLPRLRILSMEKAQFTRASLTGTLCQRFSDCLMKRKIIGGVRWLNLSDCDIAGKEVEQLHKLVDKVWWDGKLRGCTSSANEWERSQRQDVDFRWEHVNFKSQSRSIWAVAARHLFLHDGLLSDFLVPILTE